MVTLRRESLQRSQSLSVCFISLFTENNAVEEIWFYKTQKILKKSCKPNMPLLGAKKRRIILGIKKRQTILSHQNMKIILNLQKCQVKGVSKEKKSGWFLHMSTQVFSEPT